MKLRRVHECDPAKMTGQAATAGENSYKAGFQNVRTKLRIVIRHPLIANPVFEL